MLIESKIFTNENKGTNDALEQLKRSCLEINKKLNNFGVSATIAESGKKAINKAIINATIDAQENLEDAELLSTVNNVLSDIFNHINFQANGKKILTGEELVSSQLVDLSIMHLDEPESTTNDRLQNTVAHDILDMSSNYYFSSNTH